MTLAAFLSAELGIELVANGPSHWDLWKHPANAAAFAKVSGRQLARAVQHGAAGTGDVARSCISVAICALQIQDSLDTDGAPSLLELGQHLHARHAGPWVATLVAAAGGDDLVDARTALDELQDLASSTSWPRTMHKAWRAAVPSLLALLTGPLRDEVIRTLAIMVTFVPVTARDMRPAVPQLLEMAREADGPAIRVLAAVKDRRAVEPLIAILHGPAAPRIKVDAIDALTQLRANAGRRDAVPALVELLAHAEPSERDACYRALAVLGPDRGAPAVARVADPDTLNKHVMRIVAAGARAGDPESRGFLDRAVRSTDNFVRADALVSLAEITGAAVLDRLCQAVDDPSEWVRSHAVHGLRLLRDPRAFDALVSALRQGESAAAIALGELADVRAIAPLVEALGKDHGYHQQDVRMKQATIEALGDFGRDEPSAWTMLTHRLGSSSEHVAECAALACQQLRPGCTDGVDKLVQRIRHQINVPDLLDRNLPPLARRLDGVARQGTPPLDANAARTIREALVDLERELAELGTEHAAHLVDVIATWNRWLA